MPRTIQLPDLESQTRLNLTRWTEILAADGVKAINVAWLERATSTNKKFHVVEGSNHMQLYDVPKYVDEAVSVLATFFKSNLDLKESIVEESAVA